MLAFAAAPWAAAAHAKPDADHVIFFVADGMRQDLAAHYADLGRLPTIDELMRTGAI